MKKNAVAFAVALALATTVSQLACAEDNATVIIKNFDYSPMNLTIEHGTTVMWKNLDGEPHTVVSVDGLFRSPAMDQNDIYQFKFANPGTYKYVCSIHPQMMATIVVK